MQVAGGQQDRLAGHVAVQLGEGDHRAGEGDGADGDAERHFDQALRLDARPAPPMPKACRAHRSRPAATQTGGQADQAVEGRDQLRHRGHRDCAAR